MSVSYVRFCRELGITLEPGQLVTCKVAFDGVDPCDLQGWERELAVQIFGPVERFTAAQRRVFAAACGRRSGKTRLFTAIRLLQLGLTTDLSMVAPGEAGYGIIVAPTKDQGKESLAYIRGAMQSAPPLAAALKAGIDNTDRIEIVVRGIRVAWLVVGANARGTTLRGKTCFGASLEEAAFFRDEASGVVNDQDIFDALDPSVVTGGQIMVPSSPWAMAGLLWNFYERNHGHAVDAIAAKAATVLMRSDPEIHARAAEAYARNPEKAKREFGAEFMSGGAFTFYERPLIDASLADEPYVKMPGDRLAAGSDLGFVRNSSALVVAARQGELVHLPGLYERLPASGAPLRPGETVAAFAAALKGWGVSSVMADGHYRETMREHLNAHQMYVLPAPGGAEGKTDVYGTFRELLADGRLRIPRSHALTPRLVQQLEEVKAKPLAGGTLSISSPTWTDGAHGDLAAAAILAAYQEYGVEIVAPPEAVPAELQRMIEHERSLEERAKKPAGGSLWSRGRLLLQRSRRALAPVPPRWVRGYPRRAGAEGGLDARARRTRARDRDRSRSARDARRSGSAHRGCHAWPRAQARDRGRGRARGRTP